MTESVEVKLARVEEKIDMLLRRLENGDRQFRELDTRISLIENRIAMIWGALAIVSFVIPLSVKYFFGG